MQQELILTRLNLGGLFNMYLKDSMYAAHFYENSDKNLKTNIKNINSYNNIP